jgi:hypothetical protein
VSEHEASGASTGGRVLSRHPFVAAPKHAVIMPINVVLSELGGLNAADLRTGAANEVRRARASHFE